MTSDNILTKTLLHRDMLRLDHVIFYLAKLYHDLHLNTLKFLEYSQISFLLLTIIIRHVSV